MLRFYVVTVINHIIYKEIANKAYSLASLGVMLIKYMFNKGRHLIAEISSSTCKISYILFLYNYS